MYPIVGNKDGHEYLKAISHQDAHRQPDEDAIKLIQKTREVAFNMRAFIEVNFPPSRERSIALTRVDEMRMWLCNAATINGKVNEPLHVFPPETYDVKSDKSAVDDR